MSWYHDYDGGRSFYTALGHTGASYTEPQFLQHLLGGIQYAIGENKKYNIQKLKHNSLRKMIASLKRS
jgi:type 1 glutamine amidotransferase